MNQKQSVYLELTLDKELEKKNVEPLAGGLSSLYTRLFQKSIKLPYLQEMHHRLK